MTKKISKEDIRKYYKDVHYDWRVISPDYYVKDLLILLIFINIPRLT